MVSLPCCVIRLLDFLSSRCPFGMGLSLLDSNRFGRFGRSGRLGPFGRFGFKLTGRSHSSWSLWSYWWSRTDIYLISCFCLRHFGLTNHGRGDVHATRDLVLLQDYGIVGVLCKTDIGGWAEGRSECLV